MNDSWFKRETISKLKGKTNNDQESVQLVGKLVDELDRFFLHEVDILSIVGKEAGWKKIWMTLEEANDINNPCREIVDFIVTALNDMPSIKRVPIYLISDVYYDLCGVFEKYQIKPFMKQKPRESIIRFNLNRTLVKRDDYKINIHSA